ncbi:MAG: PD-(D/E)XK nuclease family protein [Candidatus Taylorbacteria bacterium]|nr:PD-(D/E)XK nuclease family protein [Candidatus Taylorbacteria bacterium]
MAWKQYNKNYEPGQKDAFKLSRSKIDMFIECPRCFFLDRRLGVKRPSIPAFTLNSAVDHLLKKEFDAHRKEQSAHPLQKHYKLDLVPFQHEKIDEWRENFVGVQHLHTDTNFLIFGAVDDLWVSKDNMVHVVDYKATSKDNAVTELEDTQWHDQYRRQMEIYQWLLRKNGLSVSDTGYFVYVNGRKDKEAFDGKLEFDVNLIPYTGTDTWIDDVLQRIKKCLESPEIPKESGGCEYCKYRTEAGEAFKRFVLKK